MLAALEVGRGMAGAQVPPALAEQTTATVAAFAVGQAVPPGASVEPFALARVVAHELGAGGLKVALAAATFLGLLVVAVLAVGPAGEKPPVAAAPGPAALARPGRDGHGAPLPDGAAQRLGTLRMRHAEGGVVTFADDNTLISAGGDGVLRFWDVTSGRVVRTLPGPRGPLYQFGFDSNPGALALSTDGALLAIRLSVPERICVWALATGQEICSVEWLHAGGAAALVLSADGKTLAANSQYDLFLIDVASGKKRGPAWRHPEQVMYAAFSPDGKHLATSTWMGALHLWDVAAGNELWQQKAGGSSVLAFTPDGGTLASLSSGSHVHLWNPADGTLKAKLPMPRQVRVTSERSQVAFSRDGKLIAAGGGCQPVLVWDAATGKELRRLPAEGAARFAFAPERKRLATSAWGTLHVWDLTTGQELQPTEGHTAAVSAVTVSPDGQTVVSASRNDRSIRWWDVRTGRQIEALTDALADFVGLSLSADGRALVSWSQDGVIELRDARTGQPRQVFALNGKHAPTGELRRRHALGQIDRLDADQHYLYSVQLSADGKTLAAFSKNWPHGGRTSFWVWMWDTTSGRQLVRRELKETHGDLDLYGVRFSPDATLLVRNAGQQKGVVVLEEVASGKTRKLTLPYAAGAQFAASRSYLLLRHGGPDDPPEQADTTLWDVNEQRALASMSVGPAQLLVLSDDGRYLAAVQHDTLRVWELVTGQEIWKCTRPGVLGTPQRTYVWALAFTPDARQLVTALPDTTLLVWDIFSATGPGEPGRLWQDLGEPDVRRACAALGQLAQGPAAPVVALLREQLRPVSAQDMEHLRGLLRELDSDDFKKRAHAVRRLEAVKSEIQPLLRRALANATTLEARRRLEQLASPHAVPPVGEELRALRGIEVLERLATPEAQQLLEALAGGAAEARRTRAAKAAIERLRQRRAGGP